MDRAQMEYRSFSPNHDIPRLLSLYAAVENVDQEGYEVNEDILRHQMTIPGHDPLKDRWVVDEPGESSFMIGSATLRAGPQAGIVSANIIIHPDWRQRGIGSTLLMKIKERALQLGAGAVQIYASTGHAAANIFLQRHRFHPLGAYTELRLADGVRLPPVIWPYGYTMRPYSDVNSTSTLTEAMNLSYIPLWGHQEVTEEQMAEWLPDFIPEGIFLVFSEKGRAVGISRVEPSSERSKKNGMPTGYIDAPGVVPQHRRLDLYRALVLTGINWLREQDQVLIEMESWGDKLEVLKMYRELGFKDQHQLICYHFDLLDGDGKLPIPLK
jgi:mycothiol synthase